MEYGPFFNIVQLDSPETDIARLLGFDEPIVDLGARRLVRILAGSGCRTVVEEIEYIDSDFRDGYRRFYYLHHKDVARRCKRLHFFATNVTADDLWVMTASVTDRYLGSVVLRPIPSHQLGTTFLSPKVIHSSYPGAYAEERRDVLCVANHTLNIAGNSVRHLATPWIQQDSQVAACASSSIWIANRYMSEQFPRDFQLFTTAAITDHAVRFNLDTGRGMPSNGLTVEQMLLALRSMGYESLYIEPETPQAAYSLATHYLRSQIPVIMIISLPGRGGHATTLVGHTTTNQKRVVNAEPVRDRYTTFFDDISAYVPRFIMQDDSGGPFRFAEIYTPAEAALQAGITDEALQAGITDEEWSVLLRDGGPCIVRIDGETDCADIALLQSMVIPLPRRVTLSDDLAQRNAKRIVDHLLVKENRLTDSTLIFDTYLRPSNEYKAWWSPPSPRPQDIAPIVRRHLFPHWVWVTDLCRVEGEGWSIIGQIVQDSSGRGTDDIFDDVVALLFPDGVSMCSPDGKMNSSPREPEAAPIATAAFGQT